MSNESSMSYENSQQQIANRKQKYKELIEKGSELHDNLENQDVLSTFKNILDIATTCENISSDFVKDGEIEHANEYLMDAQIVKMSHDLMGSTAEKMRKSDFCEEEYITALKDIFTTSNGSYDFSSLAEIAGRCCKATNFSISLLGTFELDAAPRPEKIHKERQRNRSNLDTVKAPENIKSIRKSGAGAEKFNKVYQEIYRVSEERQTNQIPYYEIICDPNDFMKSVDIAFQISFLVQADFLGLKKFNNEPHVIIKGRKESTLHSQHNNSHETVQVVMSLNTKIWREQIKKFNITLPLLNLIQEDGENHSD
ncbi:CLUMA_CG000086, isoform A [Clunio marinus]|uniref:Non-structural maintenance of chromosomes element 4 n=1 Tax=Clunio marinus TaxID=568069 RepID=A0A1J1HER8_9DIPT|nr:CLUMA_CG000086, isoform A [Clunio marinus]